MDDIIKSIKTALSNKNWYVALFTCLVMPDICGKIEFPYLSSSKRFVQWFNKYLLEKYTSRVGAKRIEHIFLSGEDCYALRCSLLHEGKDDITDQRIRKALDNFHFNIPSENFIHLNQVNSTLQIRVDIFCNDVINALEKWLNDINDDKKKRLDEVLKITKFTRL